MFLFASMDFTKACSFEHFDLFCVLATSSINNMLKLADFVQSRADKVNWRFGTGNISQYIVTFHPKLEDNCNVIILLALSACKPQRQLS